MSSQLCEARTSGGLSTLIPEEISVYRFIGTSGGEMSADPLESTDRVEDALAALHPEGELEEGYPGR